jgi:hypothetical protein
MVERRRRVSARFLLGFTDEEIQEARECAAMPGTETARFLQSRPPKLVVTLSPKATDGEVEAVAARLNALEHSTDVTVNEV